MTQSQSPESDDDSPGPSSPSAVNGTHSNGPASLANGPYQDQKLQHGQSSAAAAASLFPNGNTNGPNITQVRVYHFHV